jgi:TolA-binding protein
MIFNFIDMKKNVLFFTLIAFACLSCKETHDPSVTSSSTVEGSSTTAVNQVEKREESIQQGSKELAVLVKEARIEKNRRDSVFAANREEVWVYQIGTHKKEAKDFEKTYNLLSKRMQNLYFFKQSLGNYSLILHDGYNSEQELLDKQNEIETTLQQAGVQDKVSVINITTHCGLKEKIKPTDEVKLTCKEMAVCYTCD